MPPLEKDWDQQVVAVEQLARTPGFRRLRRQIVELASPRPDDEVLDVGAGTGLLTLAVAPVVRKVWAIDISPSMIEYLRMKAASAGCENVEAAVASAVSLPLVDRSITLVVSNYCYHHLEDGDKEQALAEAYRVLAPGGRIVIADMMFRLRMTEPRDRRVVGAKVKALVKRGPAGLLRLLRNAARVLLRRWEQPADADWWRGALERVGFEEIELRLLEHEGGLVVARRPGSSEAHTPVRLTAIAQPR